MAQHDVDPVAGAQALGELFGKIDGAMLAARASKSDHQVLEAAALVFMNARIHQRQAASEELVHAFLLIQIFDDRSVSSRERLEAFLAARVGEAAPATTQSP